MKHRDHNCREHIVRRIPPTSKTFASGGNPEHVCGVCGKQVPLLMRRSEVLMRVKP